MQSKIGLPASWRYQGPDPIVEGAAWFDTGRDISVLVLFRQIIRAMDWRRSNEEPDVWVAA